MKLNSVNSLLAITIGLLLSAIVLFWFFIINNSTPSIDQSNNSTVTSLDSENSEIELRNSQDTSTNKTETDIPINPSKTSFSKHASKNTHSSSTIDFSKYITDPNHIEEIRQYSSQKSDDLIKHDLGNGDLMMDFEDRFSSVRVAVVDEDGNIHIGDWAPPEN